MTKGENETVYHNYYLSNIQKYKHDTNQQNHWVTPPPHQNTLSNCIIVTNRKQYKQ
jgi:hypothetical protein